MVSEENSMQPSTTTQQSSLVSREAIRRRTLTLGLILEEEEGGIYKTPARRSRPSREELSSIRSFHSPLTFQQHIRTLSVPSYCPDTRFPDLQTQSRPAFHSPVEARTVHVTRMSTFTSTTATAPLPQMLGDAHCGLCTTTPSHRLIPCQHTVCYDHLLLGHDAESLIQSICAKCHQVSYMTLNSPASFHLRHPSVL